MFPAREAQEQDDDAELDDFDGNLTKEKEKNCPPEDSQAAYAVDIDSDGNVPENSQAAHAVDIDSDGTVPEDSQTAYAVDINSDGIAPDEKEDTAQVT